ncbi:MAG TPA: Stp1/IreP family PP2C-type Ser/Thr phosphatase [Bacilli bacterium]
MKTASKSDTGLVRLVNEDRAVVQHDLHGFTLAIVADGMGGHQAGDIASQLAIETVQSELQHIDSGLGLSACAAELAAAVRTANRKVFDLASSEDLYQGMGTTIVAALATSEIIIVAHIGDSRAYLFSADQVTQLTEDHSLVNELVKSGQISPEEANSHPRKNVLTRALGTEENVEVEISQHKWKKGDIVLMCSDGLSNLVDEETIKSAVYAEADLEQKASRLVASALEAGGDDNITVVLLENDESGRNGEG